MCLLLPLPIVFPYLAYVLAFRYTCVPYNSAPCSALLTLSFPGSDLLALLAFRAWLWASNRFCQCFGRIPGEGGQLYRDLRRGIIRPARKRTNWKMLYIVHILDALADLDIAWCGGTGMSAVWSGSGGYPGGRKQAAAAAVRRLARLG